MTNLFLELVRHFFLNYTDWFRGGSAILFIQDIIALILNTDDLKSCCVYVGVINLGPRIRDQNGILQTTLSVMNVMLTSGIIT